MRLRPPHSAANRSWVLASALLMLLSASACSTESGTRRHGTSDGGVTPTDLGPRADLAGLDLGPAPICETTVATAEPRPATLVFQLDTSGSMNCDRAAASCLVGDPTPAPDDSRWDVMRTELGAALASLPDSTRAGLLHYPSTFSCAPSDAPPLVAVDVLSTTRALIAAATAALAPQGITPTRDAVQAALTVLRARPTTEDRYLLLATDGAATVCLGCRADCSYSELDADNLALVDDVRTAASEGIRTFVVGVPGSQGYRAVLSQLATAGGSARAGCSDAGPLYCHYDLTDASTDFATGLRDALAAIGGAVVSCDYTIPANPDGTAFDPTSVNVVLYDAAGTETGRLARDPARADGWDYSDDLSHIVLHGPACDSARATEGRVEVQFGCPTVFL